MITVGYDAPQSSLILYREMWMVGKFSLLTTASSFISPKRGLRIPFTYWDRPAVFKGLSSWAGFAIIWDCLKEWGPSIIWVISPSWDTPEVWTSMVMMHHLANPQTWHDMGGYLLASSVRFLRISSGLNFWNDIGCIWLNDVKLSWNTKNHIFEYFVWWYLSLKQGNGLSQETRMFSQRRRWFYQSLGETWSNHNGYILGIEDPISGPSVALCVVKTRQRSSKYDIACGHASHLRNPCDGSLDPYADSWPSPVWVFFAQLLTIANVMENIFKQLNFQLDIILFTNSWTQNTHIDLGPTRWSFVMTLLKTKLTP